MKTITFPDCFAGLDAVSRAVFVAMSHADQAELTFRLTLFPFLIQIST